MNMKTLGILVGVAIMIAFGSEILITVMDLINSLQNR